MKAFYITLIAVCGTAILIIALLFVCAFLIKKSVFGSRHDKNPLLKYYTAEDFNLSAKQVDISCVKGEYIRGVIYKKQEAAPKNELIIFCHGMGPGHVAYTTEIAYLCNLGYTVLAPDYYGCNLSDGKSIKSINNGAHAVAAAIYYARENLKHVGKIYLVGHSWGGHSALCAANATGEASAVVSISAPDRSEKVIYGSLRKKLPKFFADMLYPFICIVCGGESSAKAAEECSAKILLIHGEKDKLVSLQNSAYSVANGTHITKYLAKDKRHNPYNTVAAEKKLAELMKSLSKAKSGEVGEELFKTFDFAAATEEDAEIMEQIAAFLAEN